MQTAAAITHYVIIDQQTKRQVGKPYSNASRARARADKLDNDYGAYRYTARPVYAAEGV